MVCWLVIIFVVCCMLCVVRFLLLYGLSFVVCCVFCVDLCLVLVVGCWRSFVGCGLLVVICRLACIVCWSVFDARALFDFCLFVVVCVACCLFVVVCCSSFVVGMVLIVVCD